MTVVDRQVEVEKSVEVVRTVQIEVTRTPRGPEWAQALLELAHQLDAGMVYNRDVEALIRSTNALVEALNRRSNGLRR